MNQLESAYSPGLEGINAGITSICTVLPDGSSLTYRGYDIQDLAAKCSFEEVAYLLLHGELPTPNQMVAMQQTLVKARRLPDEVMNLLRSFPRGVNTMDALKAGVAVLALSDPDAGDNSTEANFRKATRLIAQIPTLVAALHRLDLGLEPVSPLGMDASHAENFLTMLLGEKPGPVVAKLFDATLSIYAEHGFNASTFAGRVIVSTLSDMHSGVLGAIGALKGPLHGGANEQAILMLQAIGSLDNVDPWLEDALANKKTIMGFGHRAYKQGDPRARLLTRMRDDLIKELNSDAPWPAMADRLADRLLEAKNLHPNVDYPIGYMYYMMGIPTRVYTPIFAIGRIAGWTAHIIEQLAANRLIRPNAVYTGPDARPLLPLSQR